MRDILSESRNLARFKKCEICSTLPASIKAMEPPQMEAMEELPFDSKTSEVNLIVNGKSGGITDFNAFSAKAPWPSSRRPELPIRPMSLVA